MRYALLIARLHGEQKFTAGLVTDPATATREFKDLVANPPAELAELHLLVSDQGVTKRKRFGPAPNQAPAAPQEPEVPKEPEAPKEPQGPPAPEPPQAPEVPTDPAEPPSPDEQTPGETLDLTPPPVENGPDSGAAPRGRRR